MSDTDIICIIATILAAYAFPWIVIQVAKGMED